MEFDKVTFNVASVIRRLPFLEQLDWTKDHRYTDHDVIQILHSSRSIRKLALTSDAALPGLTSQCAHSPLPFFPDIREFKFKQLGLHRDSSRKRLRKFCQAFSTRLDKMHLSKCIFTDADDEKTCLNELGAMGIAHVRSTDAKFSNDIRKRILDLESERVPSSKRRRNRYI